MNTNMLDPGRLAPGLLLALAGSLALPVRAAPATVLDLPSCEAMAPGGAAQLGLSIVDAPAATELTDYAVRVARLGDRLAVCAEHWDAVLPVWLPWSEALPRAYGFGLFVLALVLTLLLARRFTPAQWWKRPTLAAFGVLAAGTWLLGVALMAGFHAAGGQRLAYDHVVAIHAPGEARAQWLDLRSARDLELVLAPFRVLETPAQQAQVQAGAALPELAPEPQGQYRVHQRLNFRELAGVAAPRKRVLPVGELVTYDGARERDWWRVRSPAGDVGWVQSIWLRRLDEPVRKLPDSGKG